MASTLTHLLEPFGKVFQVFHLVAVLKMVAPQNTNISFSLKKRLVVYLIFSSKRQSDHKLFETFLKDVKTRKLIKYCFFFGFMK